MSWLAGKVGEFEDLGGNDPLDGGLPGEPHGQRSLAGSRPQSHRLAMPEVSECACAQLCAPAGGGANIGKAPARGFAAGSSPLPGLQGRSEKGAEPLAGS